MSMMTEALERISIYCHLSKPDRRREEIERELSFFPLQLSDEVYEFYQWAGAPVGMTYDADGSYSNPTYSCALERFLGNACDLVHWLSIEEAERCYSSSINDSKYLPFVSYENGWLAIAGSETQVANSPVIQRESEEDRDFLWFPSLTNMMLAIAESLETVGTIWPGVLDYHDEDYATNKYHQRIQQQEMQVYAIAQKYGSPRGIIITN